MGRTGLELTAGVLTRAGAECRRNRRWARAVIKCQHQLPAPNTLCPNAIAVDRGRVYPSEDPGEPVNAVFELVAGVVVRAGIGRYVLAFGVDRLLWLSVNGHDHRTVRAV
jgi:hypothetical protein